MYIDSLESTCHQYDDVLHSLRSAIRVISLQILLTIKHASSNRSSNNRTNNDDVESIIFDKNYIQLAHSLIDSRIYHHPSKRIVMEGIDIIFQLLTGFSN